MKASITDAGRMSRRSWGCGLLTALWWSWFREPETPAPALPP